MSARAIAYAIVGAENVRNPGEASRLLTIANDNGMGGQVHYEILKLKAHTGDILAARELKILVDSQLKIA